ncbi:hypothetical protein SAY87_008202 [Trapa incisa]|uniref:Uncharacterized protein n=1 Tax=Trapa incisa TaxID=236973 RepID=A0AAN7KGR2_9MYRT|nr:hypothetical protein SAY87_008202 [Trapa incisa]
MTTMIDDAAAEQLKSQSSSVISVEDGEEIRGHWLGFHSPWQLCFDILGLHPCQTQAPQNFFLPLLQISSAFVKIFTKEEKIPLVQVKHVSLLFKLKY